MKTVIVGGCRGCRAIIGLAFGTFLKELTLNIQGVVDVDPDGPGIPENLIDKIFEPFFRQRGRMDSVLP